MARLTFGQELPDQLPTVQAAVAEHIALLGDLREYYKERAALERHYGVTLQAMVKKTMERRVKREQALSVGMEPSKPWAGSGSGSCRSVCPSASGELLRVG